MGTFRRVVTVSSDRIIEVTLPKTIPLGQAEIVMVVQSIGDTSAHTSLSAPANLFGFLPKRLDPLLFERQIRDDWNQ